jgi:single-strand DNA-binding protein
MADTHVTLTGNLTDDPDLRFIPNGHPVANFRLAATVGVKDGDTWKDGETSFFRVNVWRQLAEHVTESLSKGDRAVVIGRLKSRSWETPEGDKRSVVEVEADEVAPACVGPSPSRSGPPTARAAGSSTTTPPSRALSSSGGRGGAHPSRPRAPRALEEVPGCTPDPTRPTPILSRPCTCWAASGCILPDLRVPADHGPHPAAL